MESIYGWFRGAIRRLGWSEIAAGLCWLAVWGAVPSALAQSRSFELTPEGLREAGGPETSDPDRAVLNEARRLIAVEEPKQAKKLMDDWIEANDRTGSPLLPEAYLTRADALIAMGREYRALYDLEFVARQYPSSPLFEVAVERELDLGIRYLEGLKKHFLGLVKIEPSRSTGEELLIRTQERLPGSGTAERAAVELADYYYRRRNLKLAAEMYEILVINFPESTEVRLARERRIFANAAGFKGPSYDATGLIEASLLIEDYRARYPADAARAGISTGLQERIDESLALQMLETAKWYIWREQEPSARYTLERLLRAHPNTSAARRALEIMRERGWIEDGQGGAGS